MRIERIGTTIYFKINGVSVYSTSEFGSGDLHADVACSRTGQSVQGLTIITGPMQRVADVQSYSDYYPYGWAMVGRNTNLSDYRFGMNGMELDNEASGDGNSYTTFFRQYDPRLGRWMSKDPVTHPWQSPYNAFDLNPIMVSDPSGADGNGGPGKLTFSNGSENLVSDIDITGPASHVTPEGSVYSDSDWGSPSGGVQLGIADVSGKASSNSSLNVEIPISVSDNTRVEKMNSYNNQNFSSGAQKRRVIDDVVRGSDVIYKGAYATLHKMNESWIIDIDGNLRPSAALKGRKIRNGITSTMDLANSSRIIGRAGYVFDAVLIFNDIVDVSLAHTPELHQEGMRILIIDAAGLAIGYINPATGLVLAFQAMVTQTDGYHQYAASGWKQEMQRIRDIWKDDPNPYLYLEDSRYTDALERYYFHCRCKPEGAPELIFKPD